MKKLRFVLYFSLIISVLLMGLDIARSSYCPVGFPLEFATKCGDFDFLPGFKYLIFAGIDYLFWFFLSLTTVSLFVLINKTRVKIYKYLLGGILITIAGYFFITPCNGFLCLFSGRGFPIAYVDDNFFPAIFAIDLVLNVLIYIVASKLHRFLKTPTLNKTSLSPSNFLNEK